MSRVLAIVTCEFAIWRAIMDSSSAILPVSRDRISEDVISVRRSRKITVEAGTLADDEDLGVIRNLDVRDLGIWR